MSVEAGKWGVIYNPKAGTRKVQKRWKEIKEYMDQKGVAYDYVQSEGFGSVERLAGILANNGYTTIVVVGGDGALNDAINGIMLSNGPGDPKECTEIIAEIRKLYDTDIPIFAICLGHQLLALANGGDTVKMKYGHRGANHPVKDLKTGKVYISTQNHGYMVKEESLDRKVAEVSFINVNDGTVEGVHYLGKNAQTVQFHPEACAGPLDTDFLFDVFMNMMEVSK